MMGSQHGSLIGKRALGVLLAGAALTGGMIVAPTVSLAFSSGFDAQPVSLAARGGIGSFTPASVDRRLASTITVKALSRSGLFKFTPSGAQDRPDRSVTVAVRIDDEAVRAISVRTALAPAATKPGAAPLRIAPTAFNLGIARGYESFAPKLATPAIDVRKIDMPDLAAFDAARPSRKSDSASPSRFAPRIAVAEKENPGRAPRTLESEGDVSLDVGGQYRLTRNLDLTAGVRYTADRDRVAPLTDATQDSQAVYVGTKFRF